MPYGKSGKMSKSNPYNGETGSEYGHKGMAGAYVGQDMSRDPKTVVDAPVPTKVPKFKTND